MGTLKDMVEYCCTCGERLEQGQIGDCDECQKPRAAVKALNYGQGNAAMVLSSKINEPIATTLTYTRDDLEKRRRHREVTQSGVVFDGELAGPGGMSFVLLREASTTDAMLIAAVHELRCNRDVVGKIKVTSVIE